jgi:hypothetical protein
MPKYLLLLHGDEDGERALTDEERRTIVDGHRALIGELAAAGSLVASEALTDSSRARVVRNGSVTDGPFAETKELVGGFYVVDCADEGEALAVASRIPASPGLAVEVRPIAEM